MTIRTNTLASRLLYVFVIMFAASLNLFSQSSGPVRAFEQNKAKYTREFFSMGEDASSGYDYVFYKSGPKIVMIRVIWSASHSNELRINDFYFNDAIVLHRRQTATKRRLSLLKRGRNVPLTVKEEHHFTGGKLTKWVLDGKTIAVTDARWKKTEEDALEQAKLEREGYAFLKENQ